MKQITKDLLREVSEWTGEFAGAYNLGRTASAPAASPPRTSPSNPRPTAPAW